MAIFIFPLLKGCYFFMIFLSSNKMVIYLCLFVGLKWGFRKFQLHCSVERLAEGISHSFCQFQMRVIFSEKVQMQQLAKKWLIFMNAFYSLILDLPSAVIVVRSHTIAPETLQWVTFPLSNQVQQKFNLRNC